MNASGVENGNESARVSGVENGSVSATAMVNAGGIDDEGHMDQVILIHDEAHNWFGSLDPGWGSRWDLRLSLDESHLLGICLGDNGLGSKLETMRIESI